MIFQNGVVNGAGFTPQAPVSPGFIVSIFGDNLSVRLTGSGLEGFFAAAQDARRL